MIKTLLQAPPQIISNLKRKLIGHIHVLERKLQSNQEEKCQGKQDNITVKNNR